MASVLPRKKAKPPVPTRRGTAFWVERGDGAVLLRRRPEKGLLGGMMEVPSTDWGEQPQQPQMQAPLSAIWRKLPGRVEHTFTHFHLVLEVLRAETIENEALRDNGDYRWVGSEDLEGEALPTVMRKVVAHVLGKEHKPKRR